ncbi:hypothetical protein B0H14DRAFT_2966848 [Mycena olivaceomarginata]|nr:hypothetical protein B0H14DRAFT_2966848 [Mycena olivaceomarginata]
MPRSLLVPLIWSFIPPVLTATAKSELESSRAVPTNSGPGNQGLLIAHGIVCAVGFAFCLPAGVILARYLRTSRPWWYKGHWIAQFGIAGPVILVGIVLGHRVTDKYGESPADDSNHKALGNILLGLYAFQCAVGAIIHFFKPKNAKGRPPQNYLHAVFGLIIIVLGMYQIRTGYDEEWPLYAGSGRLSKSVNLLWIVWTILLGVAYATGLSLQGRRHAETQYARVANGNQYGMDAL